LFRGRVRILLSYVTPAGVHWTRLMRISPPAGRRDRPARIGGRAPGCAEQVRRRSANHSHARHAPVRPPAVYPPQLNYLIPFVTFAAPGRRLRSHAVTKRLSALTRSFLSLIDDSRFKLIFDYRISRKAVPSIFAERNAPDRSVLQHTGF